VSHRRAKMGDIVGSGRRRRQRGLVEYSRRTTLWPLKSIDKISARKKGCLFLVVATGTQILTLVCRAATFCSCVSLQGAPTLFRVKPPGRLPRLRLGPCASRQRNCCVPHADIQATRSRCCQGLSSESVRLRAASRVILASSLCVKNAEDVPGPIKAARSGAVTQQDGSRSLRSSYLSSGDAFVPAASVRTSSSRHARRSLGGFLHGFCPLVDGGALGVTQGTTPAQTAVQLEDGRVQILLGCLRPEVEALPDAWQRKQRQMFRSRWAENDRLARRRRTR